MIFYDGTRAVVAGTMLTLSLLTVANQSLMADSFTLDVTGMVSSSTVDGVPVGAGTYTLSQLATTGGAVGSVTSNDLTGVPLWALLGGNSAGGSDVVTATPTDDNGKNAILRSYVLATSVSGAQSIVSLGEIDPFFGGTGSVPAFIAYSGTDGKPELVFPGATVSGRNVADLESLQILAAPALPSGSGGPSAAVSLSGNVAQPGNYTLAALQALPSTSETVSGDTYTGVPLWTFLNPTGSNVLNQYVLASGTDGYEVLFSLAELDPALGAPLDLVPYADTQGQFPSNGIARIIVPGDNHAGRYVSNLDSIEVSAVPEPGTALLFAAPLFVLCLLRHRLLRSS